MFSNSSNWTPLDVLIVLLPRLLLPFALQPEDPSIFACISGSKIINTHPSSSLFWSSCSSLQVKISSWVTSSFVLNHSSSPPPSCLFSTSPFLLLLLPCFFPQYVFPDLYKICFSSSCFIFNLQLLQPKVRLTRSMGHKAESHIALETQEETHKHLARMNSSRALSHFGLSQNGGFYFCTDKIETSASLRATLCIL